MNDSEQTQIFDQWMQDHQGLLFKVVGAFASLSHDREDLFQQITIQLWKSIRSYDRSVAPTTWIYRVAFYTANGWRRKERRRQDQPRYAIDHSSMRKLVGRKASRIHQAADRLEWAMIAVALVAAVVLPIDAWNEGGGAHAYIVAAVCAAFAILASVSRIQRIEEPVPFDESIKGIAEQGLKQVDRHLQSLTRGFWGLHVPIAVVAAVGLSLETHLGSRWIGTLAIWAGVSLVTAISYAGVRRERREKLAEKEELEALLGKLDGAHGRP